MLSLCYYVMTCLKKKIREDFLQFIKIYNMSNKKLSDVLLKSMSDLGLNLQYLTGRGYDGIAAMSDKYNSVQKYICDKYPGALYLHYSNYFNLPIT